MQYSALVLNFFSWLLLLFSPQTSGNVSQHSYRVRVCMHVEIWGEAGLRQRVSRVHVSGGVVSNDWVRVTWNHAEYTCMYGGVDFLTCQRQQGTTYRYAYKCLLGLGLSLELKLVQTEVYCFTISNM